MEHVHSHDHHHHTIELKSINTAFIVGIVLNFLFVLVEVFFGLYTHSLSLLSDAGHNLADVGALAISLLAFRLVKVKPTERYTYGYRKTSILTALLNSAVLLLSIGAIVYEAVNRLFSPEPLEGGMIAIVAGIGILINGFTAFLFLKDKEKDINLKSAYLHMVADALVSLALVIAGIVIHFTSWYWLDPVSSIVICLVIISGTWRLLRDSLRLSLDGVPEGISLQEVKTAVLKTDGVLDMHHLHVWAMSTTENAATAHLMVDSSATMHELEKIKASVKHSLEHLNIQHVTLEMETSAECGAQECVTV